MRNALIFTTLLGVLSITQSGCRSSSAQHLPDPNPDIAFDLSRIEVIHGCALPDGRLVLAGGDFDASGTSLLGFELFVSDGTEEGTFLLMEINPGPGSGVERIFQPSLNGGCYFEGITPGEGKELWFTDGTPEGTFMIEDSTPGSASSRLRAPIVGPESLTFIVNTGEPADSFYGTRILTFIEN